MVLAGEPEGELMESAAADDHRTRVLEARDARCSLLRGGRRKAGASSVGSAGMIDEVLDRDRHAGERTGILATFDPGVDGGRGGERALLIDQGEGVEARLGGLSALQVKL